MTHGIIRPKGLLLPGQALVYDRDRRPVGRFRARDVAFQFRMGAGFPGDVNRSHPASIEPVAQASANQPTLWGQALMIDTTTQGVRVVTTGDSAATAIYGILARPFPIQDGGGGGETFGNAAIGAGGPSTTSQSLDALRSGYIIVVVSGATTNVKKGVGVWIWFAAPSGAHITGGFEAQNTGGSTFALDAKTSWNGTPDTNGYAEIAFNI